MDIKGEKRRGIPSMKSPDLKLAAWLDKKLQFRGYEFPLKKIALAAVLAVSVSLILAYAVFSGEKNQAVDPNVALQKEIESLTGRISKFMDLPTEEQPTLATVTDRAKLKDQDFFAHAQNGDKLLIYRKSKKALLYRPETGKLVEATNLTTAAENGSPIVSQTDLVSENQQN